MQRGETGKGEIESKKKRTKKREGVREGWERIKERNIRRSKDEWRGRDKVTNRRSRED